MDQGGTCGSSTARTASASCTSPMTASTFSTSHRLSPSIHTRHRHTYTQSALSHTQRHRLSPTTHTDTRHTDMHTKDKGQAQRSLTHGVSAYMDLVCMPTAETHQSLARRSTASTRTRPYILPARTVKEGPSIGPRILELQVPTSGVGLQQVHPLLPLHLAHAAQRQ